MVKVVQIDTFWTRKGENNENLTYNLSEILELQLKIVSAHSSRFFIKIRAGVSI